MLKHWFLYCVKSKITVLLKVDLRAKHVMSIWTWCRCVPRGFLLQDKLYLAAQTLSSERGRINSWGHSEPKMSCALLLNAQSFVCTLSPSRNSLSSIHWVDFTWQLECYRSTLPLGNLIKLRFGCLPTLLSWDKALPASRTHPPCHSWSHTNPSRFFGIQSRNALKWNTKQSLHQNTLQSKK